MGKFIKQLLGRVLEKALADRINEWLGIAFPSVGSWLFFNAEWWSDMLSESTRDLLAGVSIWLAVFCSLMALSSFLFTKRKKDAKPKPDEKQYLGLLIERVLGPDIFGQHISYQDARFDIEKMESFLAQLRQAAADGSLKTYGRANTQAVAPLLEIPKEHWADWKLDELDVLRDRTAVTVPVHPQMDRSKGLKDIHVNRAQAEEIWPVPKKRLRVEYNSPIKVKYD